MAMVGSAYLPVPENLLPTHKEKMSNALKAERKVNRITFDKSEAIPGETLYVSVPKLNENEVLVDKLVIKYEGTILRDTVSYGISKIWEDLFLSKEERDNMLFEGIQTTKLNKIRSNLKRWR